MEDTNISKLSDTFKDIIEECSEVKDSLLGQECLDLLGDCSKVAKVFLISKKLKII